MSVFLEVAANAARKAGRFLRESFNQPGEVRYKGDGHINPASSADAGAEDIILKLLGSRFPDHTFISEERGTTGKKSEYTWFIDPLDGTVNFIHGYPNFTVSIALVEGSQVTVGVILNPLTRELFTAERGQGACLNGRPIRVSRTSLLDESLICLAFPYDRHSVEFDKLISLIVRLSRSSQAVRRDGSTAQSLANLACGRCDGFCVAGNQPWDYCAGILIVAEAGGLVTDFKGDPCRISGGEVLASNGRIHEAIREYLREPPSRE